MEQTMHKLNKFTLIILSLCATTLYAEDSNPNIAQMQQQLQILQAQRDQLQTNVNTMLTQLTTLNTQMTTLQTNIKSAQVNANNSSISWAASSAGTLPANAFVAATNNQNNVYICQASYTPSAYQGGTYPGVVQGNTCVITYGGLAYPQQNYTVLTNKASLYWVDQATAGNLFPTQSPSPPWVNFTVMPGATAKAGQLPQATIPPAVVGGSENMNSVYICRAHIGTQWLIGKLVNPTNCMLAVNGKEASWPVYQVLMTKQS